MKLLPRLLLALVLATFSHSAAAETAKDREFRERINAETRSIERKQRKEELSENNKPYQQPVQNVTQNKDEVTKQNMESAENKLSELQAIAKSKKLKMEERATRYKLIKALVVMAICVPLLYVFFRVLKNTGCLSNTMQGRLFLLTMILAVFSVCAYFFIERDEGTVLDWNFDEKFGHASTYIITTKATFRIYELAFMVKGQEVKRTVYDDRLLVGGKKYSYTKE